MNNLDLENAVEVYSNMFKRVKTEMKKAIIGQDHILDTLMRALICNGHVLVEGVPGVAKTLVVSVLAETIKDVIFQRIQFTPDLLPTDITGVTIYDEKKGEFYIVKGPVFGNIVIGDEINRTPPKVQSSMLQAMQERQVTIGKETFDLPKPFFVMATQNPVETKGVYPLPEAQVDRFLFKSLMTYPKKEDEVDIVENNSDNKEMAEYGIEHVITLNDILEVQRIVKDIYISDELKRYILHIIDATRKPKKYDMENAPYMQWGGSPRATIYLGLSSRAHALLNGRTYVKPEDIRTVAKEVLRHRIILNYEGKAKEIGTDDIIEEIIKKVPVL
ncbi:MAG: MoxR family ATPase [Candidatus Aenigmarchaeota archaeon]|nr:MoxR family ATPase [Candidatus Aenigmarchaeota archaeon]